MRNPKAEKILLGTIKACLYLIMFTPLLFSASFFFPMIFLKAYYARLIIEIVIVAYIPLAVMSPRFRPRANIVSWLVLAFAVWVFVTAIAGVDFNFSFWGNYERMDGIFSWLHYWLLFLIAASVIKTQREWYSVFSASIVAAVLVSIYGFLQRAGWQKLGPIPFYESGLGRITATIGNPGFVAAYLLFNITFAIKIIVDKTLHYGWRLAAVPPLAALFLAYIFSGIRGAFVGLLVGIFVFFVVYLIWDANNKIRKIIIPIFAVLVIVLGLMFAFNDSKYIGGNQYFGRLFNLSLSDSTAQTRLVSWRGTLQGIVKENFWLGVGPQKFDVIFNKYFDPKFYQLVGDETWWDRAHNMFLEVFGTMGIFGVLIYLNVGVALIYLLIKIGRADRRRRLEAILIIAMLLTYFVQNLFIFDSIPVYIMLALLMAYIVSHYLVVMSGFDKQEVGRFWGKIITIIKKPFYRIKSEYWSMALIIVFILMTPVAYAGNIRLWKHNRTILQALSPSNISLQRRLDIYREIFEMSDFDRREVAIRLGQFLGQVAAYQPLEIEEAKNSFGFSLSELEKSRVANPKDVRLLLTYGNAANVYGNLLIQAGSSEMAASTLKTAETVLLQAASLGRSRQQVFHSLANTYLIQGKSDKAIQLLQETIKLNPETGTTYWVLALAYLQVNDADKAIEQALQAVNHGYNFRGENEVNSIANILLARKDYDTLLILYRRAAEVITTASTQGRLAALLAQMGKKEEAIAAALEVVKRDNNYAAQAQEFIDLVRSGRDHDFINSLQ